MFVKKSTYKALKKEYERLESKVYALVVENAELIDKIKERKCEKENEKHVCNGYCKGCAYLIEANEAYDHYDPCAQPYAAKVEKPMRLCALDRKCKDYI